MVLFSSFNYLFGGIPFPTPEGLGIGSTTQGFNAILVVVLSVSGLLAGLYVLLRSVRLVDMLEQVKEMERLATISHLSSGIASEVRNPLAVISGYVQLLQRDLKEGVYDSARLERSLQSMANEIDEITQLTDQVVLLTRPAGPTQSIELDALVRERVEARLNQRSDTKGRILQVLHHQPLYVHGNPEQLGEMLDHLLVNAEEATSGIGGNILIGTGLSSDGRMAELWVRDEGDAIRPSDLPHVFDPFYATSRRNPGLDLAICNRIVREHGGSIGIHSYPGRGCEFRVQLPLHTVGKNQESTRRMDPNQVSPDLRGAQ